MKVSTKGRYALRFMVELARSSEGSRLPIKEVAKHQEISEKYLEQIAHTLVSDDLVKSTRGPQGGYLIGRPADQITVGDVLRCCEGDLSPVMCVSDCGTDCERADECDTIYVWQALKDATDKIIDGITIQDLVDRKAKSLPDAADGTGETGASRS